jgi:CRP-like cAMP-binding protein
VAASLPDGGPLSRLIRKLQHSIDLSDDESEAIRNLPMWVMYFEADQDIVRQGDRPSRSCFVLKGITCTYKHAAGGKRQIVSFHIPGDVPDLHSLHLTVLDTSLATITPCKIGFVQHDALRHLCSRFPRIAGALWRETMVDAAIFQEWMTNIGQRSAYARIAHLICELFIRFRAVGLAKDYTIGFPITQDEIGDAMGLSSVHVNRSLQALRKNGLIALKNVSLEILDWPGLQDAGDFDPTYLHLTNEPGSEPRQNALQPPPPS